jgi:hypothetical protein
MDSQYAPYTDSGSVDLIAAPDNSAPVYSGYMSPESIAFGAIPDDTYSPCDVSQAGLPEEEPEKQPEEEEPEEEPEEDDEESKEGFAAKGGMNTLEKIVLAIVVLLILAIIGYFVVKKIKGGSGDAGGSGNASDDASDDN